MTLFKGINISSAYILFNLDTWQSGLVQCALFYNNKNSYTKKTMLL